MAQAQKEGRDSVHNLPYGPRTRLIRGMHLMYIRTNLPEVQTNRKNGTLYSFAATLVTGPARKKFNNKQKRVKKCNPGLEQ